MSSSIPLFKSRKTLGPNVKGLDGFLAKFFKLCQRSGPQKKASRLLLLLLLLLLFLLRQR